ncbi:hypothetical protein NMY22_g3842 [Coprinellus aureogranulatus]|nr:hypothetical protein NMY22_g3842 [Coprinellus aureogranulatus]
MDRSYSHGQRPRPDTVFSNESVDSIYLQYGIDTGAQNDDPRRRDTLYNLPNHSEGSTTTLVTPPSHPSNANPTGASHILARNNGGGRGHRRQDSISSTNSVSTTETLPSYTSHENLIPPRPAGDEGSDDSHQANVDRNLSIYSLYRRDTRSRINSYVPRVPLQPNIGQGIGVAQSRQGHHRRQTSDFSLVSNGSELTLVHSNASHLDLDLEKGKGPHGKSKLGQLDDSSSFDLHPDKELPVPPVTPTPRRVLRRTGLCCGLCCFATLILLCLCAVSFMMLAVNANLDGWGHRDVAHMPFGFKSPRPHKAPGDGGGDAGGKSTKSVLFKVVPTVTATRS